MENKNIIQEEINRFKLLSKYDSSQTLTENTSSLSEQAQALKTLFKTDAAVARTAARELDAGLMGVKGGITRVDGVVLRNSDDIIKAVKAGKLAPAELGKVNTALLKSTKNPAVKTAVIQDVVGTTTFATKYGTKTEAEAIAALQAKGWTKADARQAIQQYKASGKTFKGGRVTTGTRTTTSTGGKGRGVNKTTPKKPRAKAGQGKIRKQPGKPSVWQQFRDKIKGMSRSKIFKYLLVAGGLYLVWKWWSDEGSAPFPDCIGKNIPEEDFERMVNEGDGSVMISDTGISAIDRVGGGKFYDDKTFKTMNEKYSGTWEEVPGVGVVINIQGNEYTMSCEGKTEEDKDEGGGGGTSYRECTSFPYSKGCKNDNIRKVQDCIGVTADGKLGPKTEKALKDAGYSVPLTQSDFDSIIKKCVPSNTEDTTTTTTTIQQGSEFLDDSQI